MGGYASLRRRMTRLGHISFFGLGIINVLFALSLIAIPIPLPLRAYRLARLRLGVGNHAGMLLPHGVARARSGIFFHPGGGVLVGLVPLIGGWLFT